MNSVRECHRAYSLSLNPSVLGMMSQTPTQVKGQGAWARCKPLAAKEGIVTALSTSGSPAGGTAHSRGLALLTHGYMLSALRACVSASYPRFTGSCEQKEVPNAPRA